MRFCLIFTYCSNILGIILEILLEISPTVIQTILEIIPTVIQNILEIIPVIFFSKILEEMLHPITKRSQFPKELLPRKCKSLISQQIHFIDEVTSDRKSVV